MNKQKKKTHSGGSAYPEALPSYGFWPTYYIDEVIVTPTYAIAYYVHFPYNYPISKTNNIQFKIRVTVVWIVLCKSAIYLSFSFCWTSMVKAISTYHQNGSDIKISLRVMVAGWHEWNGHFVQLIRHRLYRWLMPADMQYVFVAINQRIYTETRPIRTRKMMRKYLQLHKLRVPVWWICLW